tara:strand:+ start:1618 stop:2223 length:606 start_codon:yes stop_codon:yes gene_type:complete
MQKIDKTGKLPEQSEKGFKKHKNSKWSDIPEEVKTPLREELFLEQGGLCCYCCQKLKLEWSHIEHVQCRQDYPKKRFDYDNLLLSCSTPKQCDNAKGNQELSLTPLMKECDNEIKLNLAGELVSGSKRADEAIDILKLNNRQIKLWRKNLVDAINFVFDPNQSYGPPIGIQDRKTLDLIMNNYSDLYQKRELEYIIKKLTE